MALPISLRAPAYRLYIAILAAYMALAFFDWHYYACF